MLCAVSAKSATLPLTKTMAICSSDVIVNAANASQTVRIPASLSAKARSAAKSPWSWLWG